MLIEIDSRDLVQKLRRMDMERQLPFVLANTINRLTFLGRDEVQKSMDRHYQGGATRWSKSGIQYRRASKYNLVGRVVVTEGRPYVITSIEGGQVIPQKRALVQPVNIRLNTYGNIPRGRIRALTGNKQKFFVGKPAGWGGNSNLEGVWERMGRGGKTSLRMVAAFEPRRYQRAFFPAKRIALMRAKIAYDRTLREELQKAIRTSR